MNAPDLSPEPGWSPPGPLLSRIYGPQRKVPSFVSGEPEGDRIRVAYYRRDDDGALVGKAWFGPGCEGPPRHAHGGSMSALMDEVLGFAGWEAGHPVMAAQLVVDFRNLLPLGIVTRFEGHVESVAGRKVRTRGRLWDGDSTVFAEATGLFLIVRPEVLEELRKHVP